MTVVSDSVSNNARTGGESRESVGEERLVYVVDDDDSVRRSLVRLLTSAGFRTQDFASAEAFLSAQIEAHPACVLLDMNLPEASGQDVLRILGTRERAIPVIVITGYGSIPMTVQAMRSGAFEFLTKPLLADGLLAAVYAALVADAQNASKRQELTQTAARYQLLTPRERQVAGCVVDGMKNKQIAKALGISEITVKVHRHRVMEKMHAKSVAELVRMAERLQVNEMTRISP